MFFGWLGFKQLFVYLSTMKKNYQKHIRIVEAKNDPDT